MISAELIHRAMGFYLKKGFNFLPVPFVIDEASSALTRPPGVTEMFHAPGRVYAGSAEQSFLELQALGQLPKGSWQALTPCVRDEAVLDDTHYRVFLKLELIEVGAETMGPILSAAFKLWQSLGLTPHVKGTPAGADLMSHRNGIELGSFGVRTRLGITYAYGTGLAEPRGSLALRELRR